MEVEQLLVERVDDGGHERPLGAVLEVAQRLLGVAGAGDEEAHQGSVGRGKGLQLGWQMGGGEDFGVAPVAFDGALEFPQPAWRGAVFGALALHHDADLVLESADQVDAAVGFPSAAMESEGAEVLEQSLGDLFECIAKLDE